MSVEKPSDKPVQVWAVNGTIHSGHDSEAQAEATCLRCNAEAERLGIKGRYEVRTADAS